jgi:hypothetical protein
MKIIKLSFIVISLCFSLALKGQSKLDSVNSMFENIKENNLLISVLTGLEAIECPVGILRTISNVEYIMAISEARLNQQGIYECDIYLRIQMGNRPTGKDVIFFGAGGVPLSNSGGIKGDVSLALLAPYTFDFSQDIWLTLLGAIDGGTVGVSPTRAVINCEGFKELSISAELVFSEKLLKPVDSSSRQLRTQFQTTVKSLDDIIAQVSLPPFEIPGLSDWHFSVTDAVFDMSETQSAQGMLFPPSYQNEYPDTELRNLWKGVFIREISVTLPKAFSSSNSDDILIRGHNLLIDHRGFSGALSASPVFGLNQGSAGGWAFSMNRVSLTFDRNNLTAGSFAGEIQLPVSESPLRYDGLLSMPNNYALTVALTDEMSFDVWRAAQVKLAANSSITLSYAEASKKFVGTAVLHGAVKMSISHASASLSDRAGSDGVGSDLVSGGGSADTDRSRSVAQIDDFRFSNMRLSTEAPYFQVQSFTYDKPISIGGFPADVSEIGVTAVGGNLSLGFKVRVGLTSQDDNGFGGSMYMAIHSRLQTGGGRQRWVYDKVELGEISINASTSAFSLKGTLGIFEDDEVYGTGFYGSVSMGIDALSLTANASAIFGKKSTYRYWYADASVTFSPGIPVFTGFEINGFSGGAAQKMRIAGAGSTHRFARSGINYVPDAEAGLMIKAGTMFRSSDGKAFTGSLGLEIAFNNSSGVRHLKLNGSGQIAANLPKTDDLAKINGSLNTLSSPEVAKSHHQNEMKSGVSSGAISVTADMQMNFEKKELTGLFEAYVQTPFITGSNAGGHMGKVEVYFGQNKWFIHAGTPVNPIGLKLGVGPISVQAKSYLMAGHDLPGMPSPPQQVMSILGKSVPDNRSTNDLQLGRGFAFGASLDIGTGRNNIAIFYSDFAAGVGFDCMLKDYGQRFCKGSNKPIGINGWYIEGQAYAYLMGEVGLTMRVLGKRRDLNILKGSAAVLMQAKLPNPSWFAGDLALNYSVLNGLVKGRCRLSIEVGEQCEFQQSAAGALAGQELISQLSPNDPQQETDVFVTPQAVFNMPIKEFRMDESSSLIRAELAEFSLSESGRPIALRATEWDDERYLAKITGEDALPGKTEIKAKVRLRFSEKIGNGNWTTVNGDDGKPYEESREATFKTGERPKTINMDHIAFAYPVPEQQYFLKDEHPNGHIKLKHNYGYLFNDQTTVVKLRFRSASEDIWVENLTWNASDLSLSWGNPALKNNTAYTFEIVSLPKDGTVSGSVQATYAQATVDGADGSSAEILTNTAEDAGSEGEFIILSYKFRTSRFNTFGEKMNQLAVSNPRTMSLMSNARIVIVLGNMTTQEGFDESDITGTIYTQNKPLIVVRSTMNDSYYLNTIKPMLYQDYPFAAHYSRELGQSTVPDWAIVVTNNYIYGTSGANLNFPWLHYLTRTYYQDHQTAQIQIALSSILKDNYSSTLTGSLPVLQANSRYNLNFAYTIPSGVVTNTSVVKTFAVP